LAQQLTVQQQKEQQERDRTAALAEQERQMQEAQKQQEAAAASARARSLKETQHYNNKMDSDRRLAAKQRTTQQAAKDQADVQYQLQSALLNEKRTEDTTRDNFKGFSNEHNAAILAEQKRQQEANTARKHHEKATAAEAAQQDEQLRREMVRQERAKQEAERNSRSQLKDFHVAQKKEQQAKLEYLKKVVYTNPVHDDFFAQFGTSAR